MKKNKHFVLSLIGFLVIPTITAVTYAGYSINENSYIWRITFFLALVTMLIQLFGLLIFVLVQMAEDSAERDVENIRRIMGK